MTDNNSLNSQGKERWKNYYKNVISSSTKSHFLMAFIQWKLIQFHIDGYYEVGDIVSEVFIKGLEAFDKGENIEDFEKWSKVTAYNVIRSFKRTLSKHNSSDLSYISDVLSEGMLEDLENFHFSNEAIADMSHAISNLSCENREIVDLKFIENRSWKEVREHIQVKLGINLTENTLRQRGKRTKEYLKTKCDQSVKNNS